MLKQTRAAIILILVASSLSIVPGGLRALNRSCRTRRRLASLKNFIGWTQPSRCPALPRVAGACPTPIHQADCIRRSKNHTTPHPPHGAS